MEEIDREVEAFDAEQGRSRIAKYIEEAVIEPPRPPPGDGEFDEDGELAGTDSASRGAAVPSRRRRDSSPGEADSDRVGARGVSESTRSRRWRLHVVMIT